MFFQDRMEAMEFQPRHLINADLAIDTLLLNKENQCKRHGKKVLKQNRTLNYTSRLSQTSFLPIFSKKETFQSQELTMLGTTSSSRSIDKSPMITAFLGAVCDVIQSLFSAPFGHLIREKTSSDRNTFEESYCMQRFRRRTMNVWEVREPPQALTAYVC